MKKEEEVTLFRRVPWGLQPVPRLNFLNAVLFPSKQIRRTAQKEAILKAYDKSANEKNLMQ